MKNLKLITERFNNLLNSKLGNVKPLLEEYDEELYNEVLDKYNKVGFEGMTEKEIEYIKSGGESDYDDTVVNKFNKTTMKVDTNPKNLSKIKSFIYSVMDDNFSDLVKYETNSRPGRLFFIKKDFNYKGKVQPPQVAMVYLPSNKSLSLSTIVDWVISVSHKEYNVDRSIWDYDLYFDFVGEWFEEKYGYEISENGNGVKLVGRLFDEYLDVTDEYNLQSLHSNGDRTSEIIQYIDSLYNKYEKELNIKVSSFDDPNFKILVYQTDSPAIFMTYNYANHLIFTNVAKNFINDIMDKYSVNLNSIKDSIGDWYENRFNNIVSKVDLSNIRK